MRHTGATRYRRFRRDPELRGAENGRPPLIARLKARPSWPLVQPAASAGALAGSIGVMVAASGRALVKAPFVPFAERHAAIVDGLSTAASMCGPDLRVTYHPGFDPEVGSVFCQNHVSMLDGPLAAAVIPQPFCGLMEAWHFHIPGYGWLMRLGKSIPVYPRESGRTAEITEVARSRIDEGISILVFPEGHRTRDGYVQDFRRGVFFMARDAAIPVVPLAVRGLYGLNRRKQWTLDPKPVEVYVGPQVSTAGLDDDGVTDLAARLTRFADVWIREGRAALEVLP